MSDEAPSPSPQPCKHPNAKTIGLWDGRARGKRVAGSTLYCPDCKATLYPEHGYKGKISDLEPVHDDTIQKIMQKAEEKSRAKA